MLEKISNYSRVRCWKPDRAEHGLVAYVDGIIPISEYLNCAYSKEQQESRGPNAYFPSDRGWFDEHSGESHFNGALPDVMVVTENDFHRLNAEREKELKDILMKCAPK